MNQQTSSMFLSNVTLIDAAYIDFQGRPCGISVSPVFEVRGAVAADEQVVIDFSKCRKMLKELIDDKERGYDHKLWIDRNSKELNATCGRSDAGHFEGYILQTPYVFLNCPRNAIRLTTLFPEGDDCNILQHVAADMGQWLTERLNKAGQMVVVTVTLPNPVPADVASIYPHVNGDHLTISQSNRISFSYTHGLPKSSSWGCQNILHGHSSFVDLVYPAANMHRARELLTKIRCDIHDAYFYDSTYLRAAVTDHGSDHVYVTERGYFNLRLTGIQQIGLDRAPTIENIVEYIAAEYAYELQRIGVTTLAVSEGLWKGAMINLPDHQWTTR